MRTHHTSLDVAVAVCNIITYTHSDKKIKSVARTMEYDKLPISQRYHFMLHVTPHITELTLVITNAKIIHSIPFPEHGIFKEK